MQSIQKARVCAVRVHGNLDGIEHDVEHLGSYPKIMSACVRLGKMDSSIAVVAGSDRSYHGCFSFNVADGYERYFAP